MAGNEIENLSKAKKWEKPNIGNVEFFQAHPLHEAAFLLSS